MPSSRQLGIGLVVLAILPLVSPIPLGDSSSSLTQRGSDSQFVTGVQGTNSPTQSAVNAIAEALEGNGHATSVSSSGVSPTGLPASLPTQNSWVEHVLEFNKDDRLLTDQLAYAFGEDGLDGDSALTFAQVLANEQAVYHRLNETLEDIQKKEFLIVALLVGAITGFILCGILYSIIACVRCFTKRDKAKKRERDSFTMISPLSKKAEGFFKKNEKEHSPRWPLGNTPIHTRGSPTPTMAVSDNTKRSEEMELADRFPKPMSTKPSLTTSTTAPALSMPRRPSSPPPRLTLPTSATFSHKPKAASVNHQSLGHTSISDILAEFDFDVDDDANERKSGESSATSASSSITAANDNGSTLVNGRNNTSNSTCSRNSNATTTSTIARGPFNLHPSVPSPALQQQGQKRQPQPNTQNPQDRQWGGSYMGRTRGSDEGSQIGIISGVNKNMNHMSMAGSTSSSRGRGVSIRMSRSGGSDGWERGDRDNSFRDRREGRSYRKARMMHDQALGGSGRR